MALSQSSLAQSLRNIMDPNAPGFVGFPASTNDALANFANAYDTYAKSATDALGNAFVGGNVSGFKGALSSLANGATPAAAASAFANAFVAYWTGGMFAVTTPAPGMAVMTTNVVLTAIPVAVLAALAPVLAVNGADGQAKANAMAAALHAGASTIILQAVGVSPPPASAPVTVPGAVV